MISQRYYGVYRRKTDYLLYLRDTEKEALYLLGRMGKKGIRGYYKEMEMEEVIHDIRYPLIKELSDIYDVYRYL